MTNYFFLLLMWLKNLLLFVLISFAESNSACLMPILIVSIYFLTSYMWLFLLTCSFFYSNSVISDNFSSMFFTSQDTPSIWSREDELWICTCLPFIVIEMEIPQSKTIFYFILQLSVRFKKYCFLLFQRLVRNSAGYCIQKCLNLGICSLLQSRKSKPPIMTDL